MAALPDRPLHRDRPGLVSSQARGMPTWRTSLIGREGDIARLVALLRDEDAPIVTITGPGGAGKTRLAVAVATDLAAEHAGGAVFVPLAPVRDAAFVPAAIARALGLPDISRLHAALRDRQLLLVLDNLEHVLDAVPAVAELLEASPHLRVLATSRTRLNVTGELIYPLPSLAPEPARVLFETRARALDPTFGITAQTAPVVDEICARLDRLPLAIELAAARTRVVVPRTLLGLLPRPLDVLAHGPRDAPERQRSLRDTIAWSHDLLGERERVVLRRLAVFAGGFTLEAAESVAGFDSDVLDALAALVDSSLVRLVGGADATGRFTMLETVREYALEYLAASGEEAEVRERHARHYLSQAEALWHAQAGLEKERWLGRLHPEHDNVRGALAWLLEHDPVAGARLAGALELYWVMFGYFAEGRGWLVRALASAPDMPPELRGWVLALGGWLAYQQGDLVRAQVEIAEALAVLRETGDTPLICICLGYLGDISLSLGAIDDARRHHEEEMRLARGLGDRRLITIATLNRGRDLAQAGDLHGAEATLEDALAQHRLAARPYGAAVALIFLGNVILAGGNTRRAAAIHLDALTQFASASDTTNVARSAEGIARAIVSDRPGEAVRIFGATARVREVLGHPVDREDQPAHEHALAHARQRLTDTDFSEQWAAGQAITWDDLVGEARAVASAFIDAADSGRRARYILSEREHEVLALLVAGRTDSEIGEELFIGRRTASTHIRHIYDKLGVSSRAEAAAEAVRRGLV